MQPLRGLSLQASGSQAGYSCCQKCLFSCCSILTLGFATVGSADLDALVVMLPNVRGFRGLVEKAIASERERERE